MTQMKGLIRQRGAIGIFGAMTLMLAILFAALAVDTGRLMMTQRHLQTVADMAALDASGNAGYCGTGDSDISLIQTAANESASRNGHTGQPLLVELGALETIQGIRHFESDPDEMPTAVRVVASKTVPASIFAGGILGGEVNLQAEAVAERNAIAGISAGTTLASVSTKQSELLNLILGDILGSEINLDAVSYQGIADLDLRLIDLVNADASIGTIEELLDADLSVGQLLALYADAVSAMDAVDVQVLTGLNELIGANVSDLTVALGDVINVTTQSPEMAANAAVNLFQLLTTTLMVANGDNAIALPLGLDILGVISADIILNVIEPPQIAIGPPGKDPTTGEWITQAKTAQVKLSVNAGSKGALALLADLDLNVSIEVAPGTAALQKIVCNSDNLPSNNGKVYIESQTGLAAINVELGLKLLSIPLGALVPSEININLQNANTKVHEYEFNKTTGLITQNGDLEDSNHTKLKDVLGNLTSNIEVKGGLLGSVVNLALMPVIVLLSPALDFLGGELLDPLLLALGIKIGIVDVELISVEIDRPELKR